MKQPIRKGKTVNGKKPKTKTRLIKSNGKLERVHPKFGTSKLEQDFAEQFLDKLGIEYLRQFEAKDIGRFYDFFLPKHNLIIEIDGGYWHADPRVVDENNLSPMQKKNKRIDEHKDEWALLHSIPIMRIWEYDIRNNPSGVMKMLKERLYIENEKQNKINMKNKRHKNILK